MQPNTPQPYTPQPIDPALFKQQVQGMNAQSQLAQLLRGPQMQQAMMDRNAQLQGVTGQGLASNAPNIFQAIGTALRRGRGRSAMSDLEAKAQALRGDVETGQMAGLQAEELNRQRNLDAQIQQALAAQNARKEIEDKKSERLREDFETWIDPKTGETRQLATTVGKGIVDENMQPVRDLGDFRRLEDNSPVIRIGGKRQQKVAAKAYAVLRNLDDVKASAAALKPEEVKLLNRPLLDVVVKGAPGDFETYVRENKINLTPAVKDYLARVNMAAARLRHGLYGSALTRMEASLANAFIPGAAGTTFEDTLRRIDVFAKDQKNILAGIEDAESMKPGTLTGRIKYQFPEEFSGKKQNTVSDNAAPLQLPDMENIAPAPLSDEELNLTDEQLQAQMQQMWLDIQKGMQQ
jgi:hypothetical protein